MNTPNAALRDAIEQAYAAFSKVSPPLELEASPLRNARQILAALSAAPLRELTEEQIGPYSGWAITTVGNDRDYRHFLPRIFELSVTNPVWLGAEPPVMASKLNMARWREWPDSQQKAVLRFFRAAFDWVVQQHPESGWSAALWACGLATLGEDASAIFDRLYSTSSPLAALQLASFIMDEAKRLRRHGEVRTSFWDDVDPEARRRIADFLTSDQSTAFLHAAASRVSDEDRLFLDAAITELQMQG